MEEILNIVGGVARFVAILGGALAAVFIGWAGIQWMSAAGDPQKMAQARMGIIGTVVGLVIVGVAFMLPGIVSEIVIEPAGGLAIEGGSGTNCDGVLRQQLVVNRTAHTPEKMQFVIRQVQSQRNECSPEKWDPVVRDPGGGIPTTGLTGSGEDISVGGMRVPPGLRVGGSKAADPRSRSWRDARNNILVYWATDIDKKPTDGSEMWLYVSDYNTWREGY